MTAILLAGSVLIARSLLKYAMQIGIQRGDVD